MTRAEISETPTRFLSSSVARRELVANATTGTTGHRLSFLHDQQFISHQWVGNILAHEMCGLRIGQRVAHTWLGQYYPGGISLRERCLQLVLNYVFRDTSICSEQGLHAFAAALADWKPCLLQGRPAVIHQLANLVGEHQALPSLKAVECCGEPLVAADRRGIEEGFRRPVFDRYGCTEVGTIAHECCYRAGLHVFSFNVLVEILDENGTPVPPGRPGRVVVTSLHNRGMPFVRYALGDICEWTEGSCECGIQGVRLTRILGKQADVVSVADGSWLTSGYFADLFRELPKPFSWRIRQERLHEIEIQVQAREALTEDEQEYVRRRVLDDTKGNLSVQLSCWSPEPERSIWDKRQLITSTVAGRGVLVHADS